VTPTDDGARPPAAASRISAALLLWLNGLPRWLFGVVLIVVAVGGLVLNGWPGAVLLGMLATFLAWLAALSWPRADAGGRALRVLAIVLILGAAVAKLAH